MPHTKSIEQILLHFTAPTLCDLKPACLFSLSKKEFSKIETQISFLYEQIRMAGKDLLLISRNDSLVLFFVYDSALLLKSLQGYNQQKYLLSKGYKFDGKLKSVLDELKVRFIENSHTTFPHEVGLFLGYPIEDVMAFEKYHGENCKFCGTWKVYGNVDEACKKMRAYNKCSSECCKLFEQGIQISKISKYWKKNFQPA